MQLCARHHAGRRWRFEDERRRTHGSRHAPGCLPTRWRARTHPPTHPPTRQMAPVLEEMLGCQILVTNFILGGSKGYDDGIWMSILKTPPATIYARAENCVSHCRRSLLPLTRGAHSGHPRPKTAGRLEAAFIGGRRRRRRCPSRPSLAHARTVVGGALWPRDGTLQVVQARAHGPVGGRACVVKADGETKQVG